MQLPLGLPGYRTYRPLIQLPLPIELVDHVHQQLLLVECIEDGGRIRVRPCSPGFYPVLWCKFPAELRQVGARYAVERIELRQPRGGHPYYCAAGEIRRLEENDHGHETISAAGHP